MSAHESLGPVLADAVREIARQEVAAALEALAGLAELNGDGSRWPAYFSVSEAAAYSGVSEERVRKLLASRTLARVQEGPGCRVLAAREDLDAMLASWRTEGATPTT